MENHDPRMYGHGDTNSGTVELMFQKLNDLSQRISVIEARLPATSDTAAAKCGSDNKDPLPLSVKKDLFDVICKEEIEESLLTKTWSELDLSLKKRMIQSVVDQLKIKGCDEVTEKDINNSLRQFYTQRRATKLSSVDKESRTNKRISAKVNRLTFEKRERAVKEALSKGELAGDEVSLIQFKQSISPIKRDIITVYDSDDENSIFQMKENKRKSLKVARDVKAKKREERKKTQISLNFNPVCTSTQNNFAQVTREPDPWDYGAGYMDRTIDSVGRPYYPGYAPFAEDLRDEPQIYRGQDLYVENSQYDSDRTFIEDY